MSRGRLVLLVAGPLAVLVGGFGPPSIAAQPFRLTQITNTTSPTAGIGNGNSTPSISANGARIAFASSRDLVPGSPGNADANSEIFLYDTTTRTFTQITHTTGGAINDRPSISADGTRIAFRSSGDLTRGNPGNADGNLEIFLYDTTTRTFTQITNTTGGNHGAPSISADGTRIAFESNRDVTPWNPGNADGNFEIFLFDATTRLLTQITNTTVGNNRNPSMSAGGTRIAFESSCDLAPGNPGNADGNLEIFLYDTTARVFSQITDTTGDGSSFIPFNAGASINADGTRIAFWSNADLAPGNPGNVDHRGQNFLFHTASGAFTQLTTTGGGSSPRINADGTRVAFQSNLDAAAGTPGNADGNGEIFLYNTATRALTQITDTIGGNNPMLGVSANSSPAINADGSRIAFQSNRDLTPGTPGNADGNEEIFLYDTTAGLTLVAALLPISRSVMVGTPAAAFATMIAVGTGTATGCTIAPQTAVPATFAYQATNPATNQVIGTANTPVDIPGGVAQTFLVTFTPTASFAPTEIRLTFTCTNTDPAPSIAGLNSLLLSASTNPVPDIVALAATLNGAGVVNIPGATATGAFAVATVNVGAGGSITVSADTGATGLPVTLLLCQTDPATAACLAAPALTVTIQMNANLTATFGIFVIGKATVSFDPARNRIFVRFTDAGSVTRGATSVAVRTQ